MMKKMNVATALVRGMGIPMRNELEDRIALAVKNLFDAEVEACWAIYDAEDARYRCICEDILDAEYLDYYINDADDAMSKVARLRKELEEAEEEYSYWIGN